MAVWTPGLTMAERDQIERVQKCALHVILGNSYLSYSQALSNLGTEKLSDRRSKLRLNFAKRLEKNEKYSNWFHPAEDIIPPYIETRSDKTLNQTKYTPVPCGTDRYNKSPNLLLIYLKKSLQHHYTVFHGLSSILQAVTTITYNNRLKT